VLHGVFASTEEFRLRFEREARAASRLEHPSCVTVLDFGRVQRLSPMEGAVDLIGIPYLVMEFVRGQSLVDRLEEGPPLPVMEAGAKADARSDLYAAGVVLFEMVCRRRPFVNADPLDTVRDHLQTPPPRPRSLAPGISAELEQVILRALAKDPGARFQTADAFIAALAACPDGSRLPPRRAIDRKKIVIGSGLTAGVMVILGILHWLHSVPAAPPPPPPVFAAPSAPIARDALSHLALAGDYQRKLWCSDAIEELERAV